MTTPMEDAVLARLEPGARAQVQARLSKQWSLPGEHPLAGLHGASLGEYGLLVLLGPKNNVGSRYFHLFLAEDGGRLADAPLALGLHNLGPFPAFNWIELTQYRSMQRFGDTRLDLAPEGLDLALFEMLSPFAPAGGHIMVEYDSPSQRASERLLTLGYPPVTSPLGYLMFQVGCRSYRDWYISEGGREGPRKLQGFKPLNAQIAREREEHLRRELTEFLAEASGGARDEWRELAGRTARELLAAL